MFLKCFVFRRTQYFANHEKALYKCQNLSTMYSHQPTKLSDDSLLESLILNKKELFYFEILINNDNKQTANIDKQ